MVITGMKKSLLLLTFFFSLIIFLSCDEEITDNPVGNQPPETSLFIFTDGEISQQQSRLTVNWWGDDPDGLIVGYYFSWDGENWTFTTDNDSLFALQIGVNDTNYTFQVAAADNGGNGSYDSEIFQNEINFGPEPFTDENDNGVYDSGEEYIDIGLIDPTPASQPFPIKNSQPEIEWNETSSLPSESYPAMTFRWEADDVDGVESISKINIALNDTNNFVSLDGGVRIITIRTDDFESAEPEMDIYINGLPENTYSEKLPGLKFDDNNRFFVQAEDISGAKSPFISLPDSSLTWFVHKPKGKLLLVDDYRETLTDNPNDFYYEKFDSLTNGQYDVLDIRNANLPFQNTTFLETINLFDAVFWYSNSPNLDLASVTVQSYLNQGGKALFSILLPDVIDIELLQSFLPLDSIYYIGSVSINTLLEPVQAGYPELAISRGMNNARTMLPSSASTLQLYNLKDDDAAGRENIAFKTLDNNMAYFGLSLHRCEKYPGSVRTLLEKIYFDDFGFSL